MTATVAEIRQIFGPFEGETTNLPPFEEIYPGQSAPVLRRSGTGLALEIMQWGFPGPAAARGRPVTNVRNLASPFWRSALRDPARRCLVPVTRFCEWTEQPDPATGRKAKKWFGMAHGAEPLFAFAGLWRPGEGGPFMAFLTCAPNPLVGAYHPKAMPVMLRPDEAGAWLDGDVETACALAKPFADADMRLIEPA